MKLLGLGMGLVAFASAASALAKPLSIDASVDSFPLASPATPPEKAPPPDSLAPTPTDRATIQKIHDANQMEIQMGSLAKDKGSTKAVREFGRKLVADHTLAERKLDAYLRRRGLDVRTLASTTSADPDHELIATKSGTEFDRAFALQMIQDHTKTIELVESARIGTADADLRTYFEELVSTLQAHKRAAQDIVVARARS